jgi:hypothetical protein
VFFSIPTQGSSEKKILVPLTYFVILTNDAALSFDFGVVAHMNSRGLAYLG